MFYFYQSRRKESVFAVQILRCQTASFQRTALIRLVIFRVSAAMDTLVSRPTVKVNVVKSNENYKQVKKEEMKNLNWKWCLIRCDYDVAIVLSSLLKLALDLSIRITLIGLEMRTIRCSSDFAAQGGGVPGGSWVPVTPPSL